ncbi:MAG: arginine--tRNA ligase [Chloroflexota bacterium]
MSLDPLLAFDAEIFDFLHDHHIDAGRIQLQPPKRPEFGERSVAVFPIAKERRQNPNHIAEEIARDFQPQRYRFISQVQPLGGYINFHLNYEAFLPAVIDAVRSSGELYGRRDDATCEVIIVEHTSVNPNKEWHIGHVRNAVIGDVVTHALRLAGHDVQVQNYIDDTGLQTAQSIFALQAFPEQKEAGEKFDHFAGRSYVKIAAELGAEKELQESLHALPTSEGSNPGAQVSESPEQVSVRTRLENIGRLQQSVLQVMHELENGKHHETVGRILKGQLETAYRLGIFYDLLSWESHLVRSHGFERAIERLSQASSVFWAREGRYKGALVIQTGEAPTEDGEVKAEVLIRSNGIPTYVGKDVAYSVWKFGLLPDPLCYVEFMEEPNGQPLWSTALEGDRWEPRQPDRVINVIGVHQSQAQETVKAALRAAGFPEAGDALFHLAHGMVSTVSGKISGRKGTTVSGDAVIDQAVSVALERVREKRSADLTDEEMRAIAEAVGIGAVRYFMVQYNPLREIVFDVSDVVSFDGNTGLYIQYALVRMSAILRRAQEEHGTNLQALQEADTSLLIHEQEKRLALHLAQYPDTVATASRTLAVNIIAEYAFELASIFNQFYRDCGVLNADGPLRDARLLLVHTVRQVLSHVCGVLGVPVIEKL